MKRSRNIRPPRQDEILERCQLALEPVDLAFQLFDVFRRRAGNVGLLAPRRVGCGEVCAEVDGLMTQFADELGITDPIICSNGTQVFDSPRG